MPHKEEDSLGQDFTRTGEPQSPQPPESEQSLGDQSTFGDAGSSASGLGEAFGSDMEVVDLSARYEIEETLGKGGMGEVLLAPDDRLFSHRSRQRSDGLGVVPLQPVWRENYSIELSTRRKYIRPPALTRPGKG